MSTSTVRATPNILERVEYLCGKHLPDSMRDWVIRDTTGPGHNRRFFTRAALMFVPFAVLALVLPSAWWVKAALILVMLLPAALFTVGLRKIYLQELLADNDIDPNIESGRQLEEHRRRAAVYEAKYRGGGG